MSSGRTNAAASGGAEPEFFALTSSNVAYVNSQLTITAPKGVKTVCGIGLFLHYTQYVPASAYYPSSRTINGPMQAVFMTGAGSYSSSDLTVQGDKISFSAMGFMYIVGGYCCYIPD